MISKVYSVLDKAVNAFLPPFFARARGEAIRSFSEAANDEKHQFRRHLDDYVLYELGEFNDAAGIFTCGEPVRIISARECLVSDPVSSSQFSMRPIAREADGSAGLS